MRIYVIALFMMGACGPIEQKLPVHEGYTAQQNVDSANSSHGSVDCECEYYQPEKVVLTFLKQELEEDLFKVDFIVKEESGKEFRHSARLRKECAEDFEKRRIIAASLERKKSGTCSPIFIKPQDYNYACWQ